jgi:hypothetical protein
MTVVMPTIKAMTAPFSYAQQKKTICPNDEGVADDATVMILIDSLQEENSSYRY